MRTSRTILVLLLTLSLAPLLTAQTPVAAGAELEKQYLALAVAQAKIDLALRQAREQEKQADGLWRTTMAAVASAHDKAQQALNHDIEAEERKEDNKDQARLDALHEKLDKLEADWKQFDEVTKPALETAIQTAQERLHAAQEVFDNLSNTQAKWKDAGLDLAPLTACFEAFAKTIADACAQIKQALAQAETERQTWAQR